MDDAFREVAPASPRLALRGPRPSGRDPDRPGLSRDEPTEVRHIREESMEWKGRRVLVTGGASFIGSHLVDALVARQAVVRVVDDLSSGRKDNLRDHLRTGAVE